MRKWLKDGIIGWVAVAALAIIVSLSIDTPYEFIPTVQYGLFLGLIIGAPGGIIGGRNQEGWAWPFVWDFLNPISLSKIVIKAPRNVSCRN
jgi:hypothetical protein